MSSRKKGGLGRGLAELLGEGPESRPATEAEETTQRRRPAAMPSGSPARAGGQAHEATAGVLEIPTSAIRPNAKQPRREIEKEPLQELARSIESVGVIQPVIVRRAGDGYELIAGERRWRAAQMAGFTLIPAIVREASDVESLELALIENVVRQDLNVMDEAFALQVLLEDLGVTQETLAAQVGKSRSAIANKVRLLELPAPVQSLLVDGSLSEGHGRALLGLRSRGDQLRLARKAARTRMSVRATEAEVRRVNESATGAAETTLTERTTISSETLDVLREQFYGTLEVMPRVRLGKKGGVVELPFDDEAGLRAMVERLGRHL